MIDKHFTDKSINFAEGETILFDKPLIWSSFDVIRKIKSVVRIKKIGHAGTLDPLATGLMILCTGKKTKQIESYQHSPKAYQGTMKLGATTLSYDLETVVHQTFPTEHITTDEIYEKLPLFTGEILQMPPSFSAIKSGGQRLYQLAKRGKEIKTEARKVNIHEFRILNINMPFVTFYVECSKGTYIRSLVHDFGKSLNSGAFLTDLRRLKIGNYCVDDAINFADFINIINSAENIVLE